MDWRARPLRWLLFALSKSWRIHEEIPDDIIPIIQGDIPAVLVFWHGGMFPIWYRFRGGRFSGLISASRDGEILSQYMEKTLGYRHVIRGSSSRGGSEALQQIVATLSQSSCLITPDGPRGPAERAKPGALIAARRTGRSIVAIGWSARRTIQLRSWDSMRIPWPFSRVNFRYCKVIGVGGEEERDVRDSKDVRDVGGDHRGADHRGGRVGAEEIQRFEDALGSVNDSALGDVGA